MSVIEGSDYLLVAKAYAEAHNKIFEIIENLHKALQIIKDCGSEEVKRDLLRDFESIYDINRSRLGNFQHFEAAIRTLNSHVVRKSIENNINDYLLNHVPSGVPSIWVELSEKVGYAINKDNIA